MAMAMAVWRFLVQRPHSEQSHNLPPGAAGWPLLGELIPFISGIHRFFKEHRQRYGGLFRTSLLWYPVVISTDSHVNKFFLHNDGQLFAPDYPSSLGRLLGKWSAINSQARGEYHKRARGAVLRFIGSSVLKQRAVSDVENIINSTLSGWEGRTVNVSHEVNEIMFSIMANYLLSLQAGTELEKLKSNYYGLQKGIVSLPLNVPGTTLYTSLQKRKAMCNQLERIIEEREKIKNISSDDLYEDQLSAIQKDGAENETDKFQWTNEYMIELFVRLIIAAMETTPKTMALAVKRLTENPHIIPQLREEHERIRRTKRENENLSWDDYKSMSFTRCVIKETLRLGDGSTNTVIMRKTIENVQVEGYTIPKGWFCMIYDGFYSMDTKYYKDPLAFNPHRWQGNNMNQAPFMAFGDGPRLCAGNELATLVISFFLYHLVTKFRWKNSPCTNTRWFESVLHKKVDCTIRVDNI